MTRAKLQMILFIHVSFRQMTGHELQEHANEASLNGNRTPLLAVDATAYSGISADASILQNNA
jgi:hypothetical protein